MFKKILAALFALVAATAFAAVDANTATQAELESIKGIGPVVSTLIVSERKKSAFKDWNDLVERVKGVGEKSAAKFSADGLTVNGAAYPGAPAAATKVKSGDAPAKTKVAATPSNAASTPATGVKKATTATEHGVDSAASATRKKAGEAKEGAGRKDAADGAKETKAERTAVKRDAKAASAAR